MSDLPFAPAVPGLEERLLAIVDVEGKIPRALEALGPVSGRDVLLVGGGDHRAAELIALGGRVRVIGATGGDATLEAPEASTDVVIGLWSAFRAPSPAALAEVDRVLRPGGLLLVVQDYGRDDLSRLRGDLPEYGAWGRREGPYLSVGFRIRVIHCFWTFATTDEAVEVLAAVFGPPGAALGRELRRPRLSYSVAVYHRLRGAARPSG